jgi:ankyrin repeat protein
MNVRDKNNNMPIHYALINKDTKMIGILFNYALIHGTIL